MDAFSHSVRFGVFGVATIILLVFAYNSYIDTYIEMRTYEMEGSVASVLSVESPGRVQMKKVSTEIKVESSGAYTTMWSFHLHVKPFSPIKKSTTFFLRLAV